MLVERVEGMIVLTFGEDENRIVLTPVQARGLAPALRSDVAAVVERLLSRR